MASFLVALLCCTFLFSIDAQKIIIAENSETFANTLSTGFIEDTVIILNITEIIIINDTIDSVSILGATVTLTCSSNMMNEYCQIIMLNSEAIFDITLTSGSNFIFDKLYISTPNIHQDLILINGASDGGEIRISSSQIVGGRIVHENVDVLLNINDCIFTQSHSYTIDNIEDYEDVIPEIGGFILAEESGSILVNNSHFSNCVALEGGCIYCVECGGVEIYNTIFTDSLAIVGGIIYIEKVDAIIGNSEFYNSQSLDEAGCMFTEEGDYFNLYSSIFMECSGYDVGAIMIDEYEEAYLTDCIFSNNVAIGKGGGMRIKSKGVFNNVSFINNTAGFNGGGLHLDIGAEITDRYVVDLSLNNCLFINNSANYAGGALHIETGNMFINNSKFYFNWSPNGGAGSITAERAFMFYSFQNTIFEENYAIQGGALWILYGSYRLNNCSCKYNDAKQIGGCIMDINPVDENVASTIKYSDISYNSATTSGGGIYFAGTELNIISTLFEYNKVYGGIGGGALSILKGKFYSMNNIYTKNSALYGAAIYVSSESLLVYLNTDLISKNNAIVNGGGIFGEKIFTSAPQFMIYNAIFDSNRVGSGGGAIYLQDTNLVNIQVGDMNDRNYASERNPYTVHINSNKWAPDISNTMFINNAHSAVYLSLVNLDLDNNTFVNNHYGALFVDDGAITDVNSKFLNNDNIGGCGGAIQMIGNSSLILDSTVFLNNTALNGGAICFDSCPYMSETKNVIMRNNIAVRSGGAVQLESNDNDECDWCQLNDDCIIDDNYIINSSVSSSFASSHSSWVIQTNFKNEQEIDNSFTISVIAQLYDSYNKPIEYLSNDMSLSVQIDDSDHDHSDNEENELELLLMVDDENSDIFNKTGFAEIQFAINDKNVNVQDDGKSFNVLLVVQSKPFQNDYRNTYSLKYKLNFQELSAGSRIFLLILIMLTIAFIFVTGALLYYYKRSRIVTAATIQFMYCILFGLLLATCGLFTFISSFNESCIITYILFHFSMLLVIGPLGGKTWRLHKIFAKAKKLKEFVVGLKRLTLYSILIPSVCLIIYVILWIFISNPTYSIILSDDSVYYYSACTSSTDAFFYISLAIIGIPVLWLSILSYEARKLPNDFNETFWIGSSLYTVILNGVLCIPLLISNVNYFLKIQLTSISSIICINMITVFLFWIKFYKARKNINKAGNTESMSALEESQKADSITKATSTTITASVDHKPAVFDIETNDPSDINSIR